MSNDDKRKAAREPWLDDDLAAAIEKCWRSRWGKPSVMAEVALAEIRRGRT